MEYLFWDVPGSVAWRAAGAVGLWCLLMLVMMESVAYIGRKK